TPPGTPARRAGRPGPGAAPAGPGCPCLQSWGRRDRVAGGVGGVVLGVVPQEQLLEGRWLAGQGTDPEPGESRQRVVEVHRVDVEGDPAPAHENVVDPGKSLETGGRPGQLGLDRGAGEVPEVG